MKVVTFSAAIDQSLVGWSVMESSAASALVTATYGGWNSHFAPRTGTYQYSPSFRDWQPLLECWCFAHCSLFFLRRRAAIERIELAKKKLPVYLISGSFTPFTPRFLHGVICEHGVCGVCALDLAKWKTHACLGSCLFWTQATMRKRRGDK